MSEAIRDSWGSTAAERESDRPYVRAPFLDEFDREFYESFGRWPAGSPHEGTTPIDTARRARIEALVTGGATEGEREAARAALSRFDASHAETDRMQRGGNYTE